MANNSNNNNGIIYKDYKGNIHIIMRMTPIILEELDDHFNVELGDMNSHGSTNSISLEEPCEIKNNGSIKSVEEQSINQQSINQQSIDQQSIKNIVKLEEDVKDNIKDNTVVDETDIKIPKKCFIFISVAICILMTILIVLIVNEFDAYI